MGPARLSPAFHPRVWGLADLAPWFPDAPASEEKKLGEAWFTAEPELPILPKFLFTSEKLSVQVHPSGECGVGKTEMWHILEAQPGAKIALGFNRLVSRDELREAAESGAIESLLRWVPVTPGETYFIAAGTVHAIGAGLTICEIQQNSDITYRLYDYGRPRELHLDLGVAATDPDAWYHPGAAREAALPGGWRRLAGCRYFATDSLRVDRELSYHPDHPGFELLICVEGAGVANGEPFAAGSVWHIPEGAAPLIITPIAPARLLRSYVPTNG